MASPLSAPTPGRCPSRHDLEQALLGLLSGDESQAIQQHLLQCEACAQLAGTIKAEDQLVAVMRDRPAAEKKGADHPPIEKVIKQADRPRGNTGPTIADRNLLFGILALQVDFISRDGLIAGMNTWVLDKKRPLSEILVEQKHLKVEHKDLVETLVAAHLKQHDNDPEKSLAALSPLVSVHQDLEQLDDDDVATSLGHVRAVHVPAARVPPPKIPAVHITADPFATTITAGASTSAGIRFQILRPHAKGGLGQVSVARDQELHREVALKEIQPKHADNPVSRERFVLEAEITGGLEHPGVVPVYGLGQYPDGRPFYAMRFIRGDTLKEALERFHAPPPRPLPPTPYGGSETPTVIEPRPPQGQKAPPAPQPDTHYVSRDAFLSLEFRRLLRRFIDVCLAVEYAHSRGVLHRDLKPGNIMLGKYGETLVVDWGLAKAVGRKDIYTEEATLRPSSALSSSGQTLHGSAIGTPAYMSPEQAVGRLEDLGPATDVYSLGATLYHLLTGKPSQQGTARVIIQRVEKGDFIRPRQIAPGVPPGLEAICLKAMCLRPEGRYKSAQDLADDVEHWLADEPVSALPETRTERTARWLRRHRAWAQAAAIALVLVSVVSVSAAALVNSARARTATALVSEKKANAQALRMFAEARQAVDTWQTGVSQVFKNYPNLQRVNARLLQEAARNYDRLAQEQSDTPELKAESALAYVRLGDVRRGLSEFDSAEKAYAAAEAIFETISRDTGNPEFSLQLANSRARLGSIRSDLGQDAQAKTSYDQAIASLAALAEQSPPSSTYRRSKAAVLVNLTFLLMKTGNLEEAAQNAREATELYAEVARQEGDARSLHDLASARTTWGEVLGMLGRTAEAIPLLQQAIAAFDEAVTADTDAPELLEGRAAARIQFANTLRAIGPETEEVDAYRAALEDYRTLLKALPDVPVYRENLALTRTDLAQLLHSAGGNHAAKEELQPALQEFTELFQFLPAVPRYHEERAVVLSTLGRVLMELDENADAETSFRESLKLYDNLVKSFPDVPDYRERRGITRSGLARLLKKQDQAPAAKKLFGDATLDFQAAVSANPDSVLARDGFAQGLVHFGNFLWESGDREEATSRYREALSLRKTMTTEPEHLCRLAGLLSHCLDPKLRDPARAVQLSEQATKAAPKNPSGWSALGAAHYRAEAWEASIQALGKAIGLRTGDRSADSFWLAMANFRKGSAEEAKAAFERAQASMKSNRPGDPELIRLRSEAAELLGL